MTGRDGPTWDEVTRAIDHARTASSDAVRARADGMPGHARTVVLASARAADAALDLVAAAMSESQARNP